MTRPTILDRDDVAVVPLEPTPEMENAFNLDFDAWLDERIEDQWHLWRAMLSSSPHSSAWQEVREYVAGLERKNTELNEKFDYDRRTYAAMAKTMQAEHRTKIAEARIAELEKRLADADVVNDAARDIITRAQQNTPDHFSNWHEAARAWKEGK